MPLKRPSVTPKSAIPSFVIFAIARARDGRPFEIGERGIGHKLRGIAGRYIDFSDDQIAIPVKKYSVVFPGKSERRGR
jgi:hypothetical protein